MGNSLPFLKKSDGRVKEKPTDQPSLVEPATTVTPRAAAEPIKDTHRHLDQDQHSHTATTSRPTNITVASVTEPKDQGESKTLESAEQSQVPLCVGANVSTVPVEEQPQASLTSSAAVGEGRGSGAKKTGHSTRTKKKRKTATHKQQHGELTFITFLGGSRRTNASDSMTLARSSMRSEPCILIRHIYWVWTIGVTVKKHDL